MFSSKHTSAHWKAGRAQGRLAGLQPEQHQASERLAPHCPAGQAGRVSARGRRRSHPIITAAVGKLMAIMRALPDRALDMEDATHRLTLDLIMQWSYNVEFSSVAGFGADAEKIGNGTRDASGAAPRGGACGAEQLLVWPSKKCTTSELAQVYACQHGYRARLLGFPSICPARHA